MTDWAASGRRDTYRVKAVDPFTLQEICELDADLSSCTLTFGYYTTNKAEADITLVNCSHVQEGLVCLVRVEHDVTLPDGTVESEVLGTFFVDKSPRNMKDDIEEKKLTCYSTMWRLSKDALDADFVRKSGTTCEGGIRSLIESVGGTLITSAEVNSAKVHTKDVYFQCGLNRLEVLNEYCGWCNWQLNVDDYGRQVLTEYIPPSSRAVSFVFEDGVNCIYLPEMDETYTGDVYNRVIARWSRENLPDNSDPTYSWGLSGKYVANAPRESEFSFDRCGRYITAVLEINEPTASADLQAAAEQYLAEHSAATRYFVIQHVGVPHLRCGMTVDFIHGDEAFFCEVTQMEMYGLEPLNITETKLKVIA